MDRAGFFITEENGHRHYGTDIDRIRRAGALRWSLAALAIGVFIAANIWHRYVLADNVIAYVVVYGGLGFSIWRIVQAKALMTEFERQWLYYQRDASQAAASAPPPEAIPATQPTGYQSDEWGI